MKKKGFTLVELLAVIIILAIIAVIATPIILGVIEKSKKGAFEDGIRGICKSAEIYQSENNVKGDSEERYFSFDSDVKSPVIRSEKLYEPLSKLRLKGDIPKEGELKLSNNEISIEASDGVYSTSYICGSDRLVVVKGDLSSTDTTIPIIDNVILRTSKTKIQVIVSARSQKVGGVISKYYYSIDGTNYVESTSSTYTFDNLETEKNYKIYVKVENKVGTQSNVYEKEAKTSYGTIIISSENGWKVSKLITIEADGEDKVEYKIGSSGTYMEYTQPFTVSESTVIYARYNDGTSTSADTTYTVSQIDGTEPNINLVVNSVGTSKITVVANCMDSESGMSKYEFYKGETLVETYVTNASSQAHAYTELGKESTNTFKVVCTNGAGLSKEDTTSETTTIVTPTYVVDKTGWQSKKTVTITYPTVTGETFINQYRVGTGEWQTVTGNIQTVEFTENGSVTARMIDEAGNEFSASTYTVGEIDGTEPNATLTVNSVGTSRVIVIAECDDAQSGITKYEFYNGGTLVKTYETTNMSQAHVYTGLGKGSTNNFKVVCTNGANKTKEASASETTTLVTPTYEVDKTGWQSKKIVTITYPTVTGETFINQYRVGTGEWQTVSGTIKEIEFIENGSVTARMMDEAGNEFSASTYTVGEIDGTFPNTSLTKNSVGSNTATVVAACSDAESGIDNYKFYNGETLVKTYETSNTSQVHIYDGLEINSTYNLKVVCTNKAGITNEGNVSVSTISLTPTYVVNKTGWQTSKIVTIMYPSISEKNLTYQYRLGTGEWQTTTSATKEIEFTENGSVTARVLDSDNKEYVASTYNVGQIDSAIPTCNIEITGTKGSNDWYTSSTVSVKAIGTTTGTSNITVALKKDGTAVANPYTISGNITNTTFSATVTTEAGVKTTCDEVVIKKDSSVPKAPTITASDNVLSGQWHTSGNAFTLEVSTQETTSGIDYYLIDTANPPTTKRNSVSIDNDVTSETYYAKACNKAGVCSDNAVYVVRADTCNPTVTISGNDTSPTNFMSGDITLTATPSTCASSVTKYQWYRGDQEISGATKNTYVATDSGTYSVKVTYETGKYATRTTVIYSSGLYNASNQLIATWGELVNYGINALNATGYNDVIAEHPELSTGRKLVMPSTVTSIADGAFSGSQLTSVVVPDSVTSIGKEAFWNSKLTTITFGSGSKLSRIASWAFQKTPLSTIELPDSVTTLGTDIFTENTTLKSFRVPAGVTSLGDALGGSKIENIVIADGSKMASLVEGNFVSTVKSIVFEGTSSLKTISECAFCGLTNLTSITLPSSVTSIGSSAFGGTKITSLEIPTGVTNVVDILDGSPITTLTFASGSKLTAIGDNAFDGTQLTSVVVPDSVTSIGKEAFWNSKLTTITFGSGSKLSSIASWAFQDTPITSITIPSSVATIYSAAFVGCSRLSQATFNNTSGWVVVDAEGFNSSNLSNKSTAATYLRSTYMDYTWRRS